MRPVGHVSAPSHLSRELSAAQRAGVGEEVTEFLELLNDDMSDTAVKVKSS